MGSSLVDGKRARRRPVAPSYRALEAGAQERALEKELQLDFPKKLLKTTTSFLLPVPDCDCQGEDGRRVKCLTRQFYPRPHGPQTTALVLVNCFETPTTMRKSMSSAMEPTGQFIKQGIHSATQSWPSKR